MLLGAAISCRLQFLSGGVEQISSWAAFALEGGLAAVALDIHFDACGAVDEAIDGGERHGLVGEDAPHSPNGWLAVMSRERRS